MSCVQSRELGAHAPRFPRFILLVSFSDVVYNCHLGSLVGTMGLCLPGDSPFQTVGLWAVSKVGGLAHVPRLLGFILLVGFDGITCDYHLGLLLGAVGLSWPGNNTFQAEGELVGCVQSREFGACVPHLPGFILLARFSDMNYLRWPGYSSFQIVGGGKFVGCLQSRGLSARASLFKVCPAGKFLSHFSDTLIKRTSNIKEIFVKNC